MFSLEWEGGKEEAGTLGPDVEVWRGVRESSNEMIAGDGLMCRGTEEVSQ